MGQQFVPYEPDQALLFPPSLDDWLPAGHLARFVSETVDQLDLEPFYARAATALRATSDPITLRATALSATLRSG